MEDRAINRNQAAMRLFEKCINTNDLELGCKLIAETEVGEGCLPK